MTRSRFSLRLLLVGIAVTVASIPARADLAADLDRQLVRESAEVTTTSGRTVRGLLDGFRDGRLHLRLATDGGEVGYSFATAEIAALVLPGADLEAEVFEQIDRGEIAQAMPALEALGRHRIRYLPVLDPARQRVLWELIAHATAGDPHTVRAVARAMAPLADTGEERRALLEAELEVALLAGPAGEAQELAASWCALADPAGRSAIGWRVLAQQAYEAGDYEQARWIALQPVTFAASPATRDLGFCYAIAIAAAEGQGDAGHARALRDDMDTRRLAWPAGFAAGPAAAEHAARAAAPGAPPRTQDSPATFDGIRKLTPTH